MPRQPPASTRSGSTRSPRTTRSNMCCSPIWPPSLTRRAVGPPARLPAEERWSGSGSLHRPAARRRDQRLALVTTSSSTPGSRYHSCSFAAAHAKAEPRPVPWSSRLARIQWPHGRNGNGTPLLPCPLAGRFPSQHKAPARQANEVPAVSPGMDRASSGEELGVSRGAATSPQIVRRGVVRLDVRPEPDSGSPFYRLQLRPRRFHRGWEAGPSPTPPLDASYFTYRRIALRASPS